MNINEYKKYLQSINNTLDNASQNYQMRERLSESPVCDMKEYKPDEKKDKSSHAPTTAAGDSLRPHSKKSDAPKKLKEDEDIIEIPECVQQYFENYFGDNLTEDTDDEDIIKAVEDLVDLCEAVCDAVGLDEAFVRDVTNNPKHMAGGPVDWSKPAGRLPHQIPAKADNSGYLKPSPEQLRTAQAPQDNSPLLQTGQGTNTKTVRPSDVQAKARAKRMKRMKKFKM